MRINILDGFLTNIFAEVLLTLIEQTVVCSNTFFELYTRNTLIVGCVPLFVTANMHC